MGEDAFKPEYLLALPIYALVLLAAIFLHEMGHYIAARIFKIPIKDVTIGQGKLLKSWGVNTGDNERTQWRIRLLPLGAYVHLDGLAFRPFYQKILTTIAGPLINFAVIPILFFAFYCAFGQPSGPNIIVGIENNLAADQAGLKVGDRVTAVNGIPLKDHKDIWRIAYDLGATRNDFTILRANETFNVAIKPGWAEYKDLRGVPRKNARYGIVWQHAPYKLKDIIKINGVETDGDTNNDIEKTRNRLIQNFDKSITINMRAPIDEQNPVRINLRGDINQGLLDKDDDFYKSVFLGGTKGNIYLRGTLAENAEKSLRYSTKLFTNIAKVPFQLFPIDKAMLQDGDAASNPDTKPINRLYALMHLFAVASIAIGLINIIPLPKLDGGQIVDQILTKTRGEKLTNKYRANVFATLLLIFYGAIVITNMDNFNGYIDSRLKKVHEFIDQKNTNPANKAISEENNG